MPQNVEIKARLNDSHAVIKSAMELCKMDAIVIEQFDTFFHTESGRLKLREINVKTNLNQFRINHMFFLN